MTSRRTSTVSTLRRQLAEHVAHPPRMPSGTSLRAAQEHGRRYRAWVNEITRLRHALADAMAADDWRMGA